MVTTLVDSGGPLDRALRAPKQGAKNRAHQGDRAWSAPVTTRAAREGCSKTNGTVIAMLRARVA